VNTGSFAAKIQGQMVRFSGKLSTGLPKVGARMVREVIYGVQSRGSVRLSEIGRALDEPTQLKKVIERLGRQLQRPGLKDQVQANLVTMGAEHIAEDTLLVLDPTDITKPYARKMEYLARVRDGSTGEIADGYWCCQVIAARRNSAEVIPLYQELYSHECPDFESENEEILRAVDRVAEGTGGRGIWVIDRGADRKKLIAPLLQRGSAFLIRMRGDRHLEVRGKRTEVREVAAKCPVRFRKTVVREEGSREKVYPLSVGGCTVRFPEFDQKLALVVIKGFGKDPLMLLTTLDIGRSKKRLWSVVEAHLARWRVEETIRFIKQSYALEDIRLLSYERLRTMAALVMAAAYFACVFLGRRAKLKILVHNIYRAARRIYGVPEFRFYAIADGIKEVFFGRSPPRQRLKPTFPDPQISLLPQGP
jgi:hypothetical protein